MCCRKGKPKSLVRVLSPLTGGSRKLQSGQYGLWLELGSIRVLFLLLQVDVSSGPGTDAACVLRPQGHAASSLGQRGGGCRRAAGLLRLSVAAAVASRGPRPCQRLPVHCDRKHTPPTPRPCHGGCRADGRRGAVGLQAHNRSRTKRRAWAFQRPPTSHDERLRPAPRELRVCGVLATLSRSAAPSTAAAHGCGCPESGDTSVASQHCAPPLLSAPYTTRSSRRRSCAPTFGAVVWASHCCGTTWPSDPTASRATRTQARSTSLARQARSPARGHASA